MNRLKLFCFCAGLLGIINAARAQSADILTPEATIQRVIATYPTVKQAEEAVKSAGYQVKMAQAAWLPVLNASASYTRVDPVATVHLGDMNLSFDPKNNYQAGVSLRQSLYDFGKNRPKVEAAKGREALYRLRQEELYQSLALNALQLYYMNSFARQAICIKKRELADYEEMLRLVNLRMQTGSATSFDVLNTQVGQSAAQTQLTELEFNLHTLQVQLSILADTTITETVALDERVEVVQTLPVLEELLKIAYVSRPEVLSADKQASIARMEESAARRSYNPSLDLSAVAGGKNGYPVHIDRMKLNYEVGVTLSIPLYEGGRRRQTTSLARSAYHTALFQKELVEKQVRQEVSEGYNRLRSDYEKVAQLTRQSALAQQAYEQAQVNYKAGTVTNLELLTSSTNLSASGLQLLQARIDYLLDYYRLQVSVGQRVW